MCSPRAPIKRRLFSLTHLFTHLPASILLPLRFHNPTHSVGGGDDGGGRNEKVGQRTKTSFFLPFTSRRRRLSFYSITTQNTRILHQHHHQHCQPRFPYSSDDDIHAYYVNEGHHRIQLPDKCGGELERRYGPENADFLVDSVNRRNSLSIWTRSLSPLLSS